MTLPRILHRIWLDPDGDDPIPAQFEEFWDRFKELNPGWEFVTWSSPERLDWLRCGEVFDRQTTHAGRSDVLRYEVLARWGGVYVDTDVEPLRPFDALLEGEPFAAWEDANLLCPTVMGSTPNHPAVLALLDSLPWWSWTFRKAQPNRQTGPYFLTYVWKKRTDVRLFPPVSFFPVHWSEKAKLGGPYPAESFAAHWWNASWLPDGPPQRVRA
jgi:inositol phosphorylceramide mannosyltransferase catalytic subunit